MSTENTAEEKRILDLLASHRRWIRQNYFDPDGVKEREEWIKECEKELEALRQMK